MKIKNIFSSFALAMLFSTSFVSADWRPLPDIAKNTISFGFFYEQVVLDNQGNATALWYESISENEKSKLGWSAKAAQAPNRIVGKLSAATLKANAKDWVMTNDFTTFPNEEITANQLGGKTNPPPGSIVINNDGLVACVWTAHLKDNPTEAIIKSSLLKPGSHVWETPKIISKNKAPSKTTFAPVGSSLTFDNNSRLYTVWTDISENNVGKIKCAHLDLNASAWSTPIVISTGSTKNLNNSNPLLAVNYLQDRISAVWVAFVNNKYALYGAFLNVSTNKWSAPQLLSNSQNTLDPLNVKISQINAGKDNNFAAASWIEVNADSSHSIKYATLDGSNKWAVNLTAASKNTILELALAIDPNQQIKIVYQAANIDKINKIFAVNIPFASKPLKPFQISGLQASLPSLVVNEDGQSTAIWTQLTNGSYAIFSGTANQDERRESTRISAEEEIPFGSYTDLTINAKGTVLAVWEKNTSDRSSTSTLQAVINKLNLPLPPTCINGEQVKNKLLLQQQRGFSNKITWCPSPTNTTLRYRIFRNGSLIGFVDSNEKLEFVDNDVKKGTTNIYSVRAKNATSQGQGIFITLP